MIFGMLNLEKWHERLTDLSTSPVIFSHFSFVNPGKKSFSTELCYSKNKQVDVLEQSVVRSVCYSIWSWLHIAWQYEGRMQQWGGGFVKYPVGSSRKALERKPTIFCKLYCRRVGNYFSNWALWRYNTIRYDELYWLALKKDKSRNKSA